MSVCALLLGAMLRWGGFPSSAVDAAGTLYTGTPGREYIDACELKLPSELSGGYGNVTAHMMSSFRSRLRSMLEGKTLRVAAIYHKKHTEITGVNDPGYKSPWPNQWLCAPWLEDNACDGRLFGREYDILSAMGDRGDFQLEWSIRRDIDGSFGETYTALAVNFTTDDRFDFDISGNWWSDTEERRKLGLVVGHHHLDASPVLVTRRAKKSNQVKLDLLVSPFSTTVWMLFLVCMVVHATMMTLVERNHVLNPTHRTPSAVDKDYLEESDEMSPASPRLKAIDEDKVARHRQKQQSRGVMMRGFLEAMAYELWMSFERFNGGDHHSFPKTRGGRIMMSIWVWVRGRREGSP